MPVRTDTGTALRTAGRMVALLAPGTSRPGAQVAALTVALAALAAAVAELRAAQQRAHQADAALAARPADCTDRCRPLFRLHHNEGANPRRPRPRAHLSPPAAGRAARSPGRFPHLPRGRAATRRAAGRPPSRIRNARGSTGGRANAGRTDRRHTLTGPAEPEAERRVQHCPWEPGGRARWS
jgi:hypothetical protein